jgi:hypothetical protein
VAILYPKSGPKRKGKGPRWGHLPSLAQVSLAQSQQRVALHQRVLNCGANPNVLAASGHPSTTYLEQTSPSCAELGWRRHESGASPSSVVGMSPRSCFPLTIIAPSALLYLAVFAGLGNALTDTRTGLVNTSD